MSKTGKKTTVMRKEAVKISSQKRSPIAKKLMQKKNPRVVNLGSLLGSGEIAFTALSQGKKTSKKSDKPTSAANPKSMLKKALGLEPAQTPRNRVFLVHQEEVAKGLQSAGKVMKNIKDLEKNIKKEMKEIDREVSKIEKIKVSVQDDS